MHPFREFRQFEGFWPGDVPCHDDLIFCSIAFLFIGLIGVGVRSIDSIVDASGEFGVGHHFDHGLHGIGGGSPCLGFFVKKAGVEVVGIGDIHDVNALDVQAQCEGVGAADIGGLKQRRNAFVGSGRGEKAPVFGQDGPADFGVPDRRIAATVFFERAFDDVEAAGDGIGAPGLDGVGLGRGGAHIGVRGENVVGFGYGGVFLMDVLDEAQVAGAHAAGSKADEVDVGVFGFDGTVERGEDFRVEGFFVGFLFLPRLRVVRNQVLKIGFVPEFEIGDRPVWEHNLQAMEFLWNDRGAHGLSLMHFGDWCDLLDKVGVEGRGESIWMSFALARVLKITAQIAEWKGEKEIATRCRRRFSNLRKNLLKHGWDGKWFLAAINDDGMPIGTSQAKEGRMFINPQSWAMLSGMVNAEEYTKIAERMEPAVDTPVGPAHNWPPFTKYQEGIGQLSGTPPGFFTNGNVYCHAAAFKIAADYEAGRTEKAFDTLMKVLPSAERSEPYAQANGYVGPTAMRAKKHVSNDPWRTGTVAWNFLNVVDRLLGFERTLGGFHLRPQLPKKWKTVRFTRPFRGIVFEIEIKTGKTSGVTVDGVSIDGNFVPVPAGGRRKNPVRVVCIQQPK